MLSDNIVIFETQGYFILIDNFTLNIFLLNESSFKVLREMKNGCTRNELEIKFGKNKVNKTLSNINELIEKKAIYILPENKFTDNQAVIKKIKPVQPKLVEGIFMIAQDCNMRCKYCYGDSGQFGNSSVMNKEMAKRFFLLFLKSVQSASCQKVKVMGGEPLLNFKTIKYIIDLWDEIQIQFSEKKVTFSFTTNGTLFTSEIIEYIKSKQIGVTISLDGPTIIQNNNRRFKDGKDIFDSVIKGMQLLNQNDIKFTIRATATSDNDLEKIYSYFESQNFSSAHIIPVDFPLKEKSMEYQWDFFQYKKYVDKEQTVLEMGCKDIIDGNDISFNAKLTEDMCKNLFVRNLSFPFKCSAGWYSAAFSTDGYIYPCQRMVGKEHYRIGNYQRGICTEKIKDIYLKALNKSDKCNLCIAFVSCKRRCMAQMAQDNGEILEIAEELCDIYRNAFKRSVALYLQLQR